MAAVASLLVGCQGSKPDVETKAAANAKPALTKLVTKDTKVGDGQVAEVGDLVVMEYTGKLGDGTQFDSNVPDDPANPVKLPFQFMLSPTKATVIDGWNKGIVGMKVGGERELEIPWALAYGAEGRPPQIPPKADLYFTVKLLGVIKSGHEQDYTFSETKKGTGPEAKSGSWVTITYKATLLNNKPVDESKGNALQFQAGTGKVGEKENVAIQGVVYGVIGMKQGGERSLVLPPALAFNPRSGNDNLTPDSIVRVDVKLLRVSDHRMPDMQVPK